ncbi:isocitrate lyase/phosphoenolpyruvate mutase family protein [Edaphobacter sp. 4G125]|nr:isocitrate lyase/phosphoenolpyruvate mutase family protein [Edaphobacter sp. 4G125]
MEVEDCRQTSLRNSEKTNLTHIAAITAAVDLPVSADFMSGYGSSPEQVAESVARCIATDEGEG